MRPSHPLGSALARMALQKEGRRTGPCVKIYCIYCSGRFCGTIRNLTPQGGTLCLTGVGWTGAFLRCILTGSWCPRAKTRWGPVCRIGNPVHGFLEKGITSAEWRTPLVFSSRGLLWCHCRTSGNPEFQGIRQNGTAAPRRNGQGCHSAEVLRKKVYRPYQKGHGHPFGLCTFYCSFSISLVSLCPLCLVGGESFPPERLQRMETEDRFGFWTDQGRSLSHARRLDCFSLASSPTLLHR